MNEHQDIGATVLGLNSHAILLHRANGQVALNDAATALIDPWGLAPRHVEELVRYGILLEADRKTPVLVDELPTSRVLSGKDPSSRVVFIAQGNADEGAFIELCAVRLNVETALCTFVNVTQYKRLEIELERHRGEMQQQKVRLREARRETHELIVRLQGALSGLSGPVRALWDDLSVLPDAGVRAGQENELGIHGLMPIAEQLLEIYFKVAFIAECHERETRALG
ncbi:MAG TPA: hypothetical protein VN764_12845 [Polyangiaceae bacterium]|nr:hypothetical protein [Polyangiaceae bacterium]